MVIQLLLEVTNFGRLPFLQTEGRLQAALAQDNGQVKPITFRVKRRRGLRGTAQLQLIPTG